MVNKNNFLFFSEEEPPKYLARLNKHKLKTHDITTYKLVILKFGSFD